MKNHLYIMIAFMLSTIFTYAQNSNNNVQTEIVKINGNCSMCKTKIENAGNADKVASVNWNKKTKQAQITYDATKTSKDEILQRIADMGYDNEAFQAPKVAYNQLPSCCQYNRDASPTIDNKKANSLHDSKSKKDFDKNCDTYKKDDGKLKDSHYEVKSLNKDVKTTNTLNADINTVVIQYLILKDALILSNETDASKAAESLTIILNNIEILDFPTGNRTVLTNNINEAIKSSKSITSSNLGQQRKLFKKMSNQVIQMLNVIGTSNTLYVQYCPMYDEGSVWVSIEDNIQNPYYGNKMLKCGKVLKEF